MDHSFKLEELKENPIVPALHCGPSHSHMGFSLASDEETEETSEK
jgi:hypothetical protein